MVIGTEPTARERMKAVATALRSRNGDRVKAALGTAALQALLAYALIAGLRVDIPAVVNDSLKVFGILAPPPPPPPEKSVPHPKKSKKPEGAASPPNLESKRTEVVAPPPVVTLPAPPPIIAAPAPDVGPDPTAGSAPVRGPGTGSGGQGRGTGSGGAGNGGGAGGRGLPPRRIRGSLADADYPRAAWEAGIGGTVSVRYRVGVNGRASDCIVTRSSGSPALDETTCRLIEKRFRFDPARDENGRPVPSTIIENHTWVIEQEPPPPPPR